MIEKIAWNMLKDMAAQQQMCMIEVEKWNHGHGNMHDPDLIQKAVELLEAKGLANYNLPSRMHGLPMPATLIITEIGRDAVKFGTYKEYLRKRPAMKNYFTLPGSRNTKGYGLWFSLFMLAMLIILKIIMKKGIL